MSAQTKSKLYLLIIGILLVTNIAVLFLFLNTDKHDGVKPKEAKPGRSKVMRDFLQNEVGFTGEQLQQFDTLSEQHKQKMKETFDAFRGNKETEFKELGAKGFSDSAVAAALKRSLDQQQQMEQNMLNHFMAIRKICTPQQQPKFDAAFYTLWSKKKKPDDKK
ncbi:MAG: periplasmic heavy metal sensor [Bacteroidetes bacterium]|nr:periplasmic heavy metal sensor [Bacteroidota bacterium]